MVLRHNELILPQMKEPITIIGAGIGGLTMALTLKQKGYPARVYESAPEIKPVGAGILMANNAMQVFKKLGIHHKIEEAGNRISTLDITNEKLASLSSINLQKFERKYAVYNVAIHRADLQKILAEAIGFENIALSKRLVSIEQQEDCKLVFEDGSVARSPVVIAADGIRSAIRNQLFDKSNIRNTGQVCWRGVCEMELPEKYQHEGIEAWGKGIRFGFVRISTKQVYWFAVASEGSVKNGQSDLLLLFKDFHPLVRDMIAVTAKENIYFSSIIDLKPIYQWHKNKVCLIGDAAHATTPNLGQGACQAVEDAYAIGQLLHENKPVENVFGQYQQLRIKKAHDIVNKSWRIGSVAHFENSFAVWLRNSLMRAVPAAANNKQLQKIFDISYIS